MNVSANQPDQSAMAVTRLFHAHDQFVLHPDIYFPDASVHGSFIPGAARKGQTGTPDEIYSNSGLVPDTNLLFEVGMAGRSEWLPGDQFIRRRSRGFSIELVTHGQGELVVGRTRFELKAGDIFILHPTEQHVYRACAPEPFRKIFINLNIITEVHQRALELLGLQKTSRLRLAPAATQRVHALLEQIITLLREHAPQAARHISVATYEILTTLTHALHPRHDTQQLAKQVEAVVRYVLGHLRAPLKITDLARVVDTSPDYLNRLFIKCLGLRAHEWLHKLRMRIAADMLCKTKLKIREIGADVGYDNAYAFTRAFKSVAGVTPEIFRQRAWKTR